MNPLFLQKPSSILKRFALVATACFYGSSQAQSYGNVPYLGSQTLFLQSRFCTKNKCSQVAKIPLGEGYYEESYLVTVGKDRPRLLGLYRTPGGVRSVYFRYFKVLITPEGNGKALADLVDFATGTRLPERQALSFLEDPDQKPLAFVANNNLRYRIFAKYSTVPDDTDLDLRFNIALDQSSVTEPGGL